MRNKSALKWIMENTKTILPYLFILTIISAVMSLCLVALTYVGKQVVDIATNAHNGIFWDRILYLVLLILAELTLQVIYSRLGIKISGKMEIDIKSNIFNRLLKKDITDIYKFHTGELLNRLTADVLVITNGFLTIVPTLVSLITRLMGAFAMLYWLDSTFATIYLFFGPMFLFATHIYSTKMKGLHKKCQESDGKIKAYIQEALANILVIKAFKTENAISSEAGKLQQVNYKYKVKRNTISIIANIIVYIAFTFGYYLALGWGAYKLSLGYITVGTLTAMLQLVSQVQTPFKGLSGIIPHFYQSLASAERLMELENLKEDTESFDNSYMKKIYDDTEKIIFSEITFKYDDRNVVIDNFSYEIEKNEFVAIKGISGVGKSTLLKLLLGVIKAEKGEMYFLLKDGTKLEINDKTRGVFSYVPQGNMILSGTIKDNIRFFNNKLTDEEIMNVCKTSRVDEFLGELPQGLDTIVGEKGIGLSEGQIQRIAIARALISESPILLLDEATSALDEKTEKEFLEGVKGLKSRTCIIVSHKQAAFDICDKTIEF